MRVVMQKEVTAMAASSTKPVKVQTGGSTPVSGQYKPKGGNTEYTFVQGNTVPPGPKGATEFTLVDPTKPKPKKNG